MRPSSTTTTAFAGLDFLDRVADIDDEDACLVAKPLEIGEDLAASRAVERGQRLVHQQQPRLGEQRPPDRSPLLLATGKLVRPAIEEVLDAEQVDDGVRARCPFACERALQAVLQVVANPKVREQACILEDVADASRLDRNVDAARGIEQRDTIRDDASGVGAEQSRDRRDDRGLAAAGAPEQRGEAMRLHREVDVEAKASQRRFRSTSSLVS